MRFPITLDLLTLLPRRDLDVPRPSGRLPRPTGVEFFVASPGELELGGRSARLYSDLEDQFVSTFHGSVWGWPAARIGRRPGSRR